MNRPSTRTRWLAAGAAALALTVTAAACSNDNDKGSSGGSTSTTTKQLPATLIKGSGATFPQAFYETAIEAFKQVQPAVTIPYAGGGSGQGQTDLQTGNVAWAGSDSTVKPEDESKFQGPFFYFPTVAAPITVSYNLSGVKLQLSADTIAKIFQKQITTWNDAAIAADNPKATLPDTPIVVVHREDPSGTTANFTKYLTKAAAGTWTLGTDKTVAWPAGTQSGTANSGVAQIVKSTAGAIGYVDYSDATFSKLQLAAIKNKSGKYVAPTLDGASAAVEGATINANLTYDPLDASGATAYPITAPTYILVYQSISDVNQGNAVKAWLNYVLTDGQKLAASVDFAKLPGDLDQQALAQVKKIKVGG